MATDRTSGKLELRRITPDDQEFLYQVYASTRVEELRQVDWDDAVKEAFLRMQFDAQHRYYQENYSTADFQIILNDENPIGRLYVARWADEIRLVDIAILPEHRNSGIGTGVLKGLMKEASESGRPLRIHVEKFNPAMGLYKRLGFVVIEDRGVYDFLEWRPYEST